jgi:membrane-associated phospholipid phosphatase
MKPLLVVLLLGRCIPVSAQEEQSVAYQIYRDGGDAFSAAVHLFSSPFHWEGKDWALAAGVVALTGTSALLDDETRDLMKRNQTFLNDRLQTIAVEYGSGLNMMLFSAGLYTAGLISDNAWVRETGLLTGTAIACAATVSTLTKGLVGRARPFLEMGNHRFKPFRLNDPFHSFPSGHTIVAFSVSAVLAERIKNPWASIGLYAVATGTAAARLYSDNHWLSDVVFGALYSTAMARSIVAWYEHRGEDTKGVSLIPTPGGFSFVWIF